MSKMHAHTITPEPEESRPLHAPALHAAPAPSTEAAQTPDVYGNTFGLPFAVWWTVTITILVTIGWMLEAQLAR